MIGSEYAMAPEVIARAAEKVAAEASEGASDERIRLRDRVVDLQHRLTEADQLASDLRQRLAEANQKAGVAYDEARTAKIERDKSYERHEAVRNQLTQLDGATRALQAKLDDARKVTNQSWVRALQRMVIEDEDLTLEMADAVCTHAGASWRPPELTIYGRVNFSTRVRGISPRSFDKDHPQMLAQEQVYAQVTVEGMVPGVFGVEESTEVDDFLINRVEWSFE